MSGRAYASKRFGGVSGATDIESFIPHRFRIAAPKIENRIKELAIRRVIQRRYKEKNWRKMLRMRYSRLSQSDCNPSSSIEDNSPVQENDPIDEGTMNPPIKAESFAVTDTQTDQHEDGNAQLQEMLMQLQTLQDQKHTQFLQLKDLLIAEARAKVTHTKRLSIPN